MTDAQKQDKPDAAGIVHSRQAPAVTICRDVYGGTLSMRAKAAEYLPKFPKETEKGYRGRVSTAVLYNAFKRTVKGLVGMVFRKDLTLGDDVPAAVKAHAENIDLEGRNLSVFAKDLLGDEMVDGHACIFVDMQRAPEGGFPTLADERRAGLRPYWIPIRKQEILRFETVNVGGKRVLRMFAYRTVTIERDGQYAQKAVERVRIYELAGAGAGEPENPVAFEVWRRDEKRGEQDQWQKESFGRLKGIKRIPLSIAYADRSGFLESDPPLLDLAHENVLHFQLRSDRHNTLHIAGVPIPVFTGIDPEKPVAVGADTGIVLPLNGTATYLEPAGNALAASRDELRDIEARMAALGLAMLERDTRQAETAEAKRLDKAEQDSALATAARGLKDALEMALSFHAEWLKDPKGGGSVGINTDFEQLSIDAALAKELREMVAAGLLSLETLLRTFERAEVFGDDFDVEEELDRIASANLDREPEEDDDVDGDAKDPADPTGKKPPKKKAVASA